MSYSVVTKMRRHLKHAGRQLFQYQLLSCTMLVSQLRGNSIIQGMAHLARLHSILQLHSIVTLRCMVIRKLRLLPMNRIIFLKFHQADMTGIN